MRQRENIQSSHSGVGLPGMLTVLFVGLKLTHYIDWSWWWVLSPMMIPFAFWLLLVLLLALRAAALDLRDILMEKKREGEEKRNAGEI